MQAVQRSTWISGVFPDVMDVQSVPLLLEISWKHLLAAIVQFTLPDLNVEINTEAFNLKLTAVCAYLKADVLHRFNHVTDQLVVLDRFESVAQFSGMNGESNQETD